MVAVTPRLFAQNVRMSYLSRNAGAAYNYDVSVDTESDKFKKMEGSGLSPFGGGGMSAFGSGLTTFGGQLATVAASGGLYPFGSGIHVMGHAAFPFGCGLFSKIKGFAKKASSVIKGAIPSSLKSAALDLGKKTVRELAPKVIGKVKEEISKQAPGLVTKLSDKVVSKLPASVQGTVGDLVNKGAEKALATIDSGLSTAESKVMSAVGGGYRGARFAPPGVDDVLPVPSSQWANFSPDQLRWMQHEGQKLGLDRSVGNVPSRLMFDQSSQSLADSILADQRYAGLKKMEAAQQLGLPMQAGAMKKPAKRLTMKPKAKAGRPKGSKTAKGKGVVYL